jgi:hypothetical protein
LLGNENIRSLNKWDKEFRMHNLIIEHDSREYIRLLPPFFLNFANYDKVIGFEQNTWRKLPLLREYFYSGVNFTAKKEDSY